MTVATLAADARLDVHASQRAFRALLDALARPGLPTLVDAPSGVPAALVPALALADVDLTVCVLGGGNPRWEEVVSIATGARAVELEQADLVVALRAPTPDEVRSVRRGRADAPEQSAWLALGCEAIGRGPVQIELRGPGVPDARAVAVAGVPAEVFDALVGINRSFPAGVDTFLVAADGTVVGIPRSSSIEVR